MVIIPGVIKSKDTVVCFCFVLQRNTTRAEPRACIRIKPKGPQHRNTESIKGNAANRSGVVFKCRDRGQSDEPACTAQREQRSLPSVRLMIFLKLVVCAPQHFYWHGRQLKIKNPICILIFTVTVRSVTIWFVTKFWVEFFWRLNVFHRSHFGSRFPTLPLSCF